MRGGVFVLQLPMKLKVVRIRRGGVECGVALVDDDGVVLPGQQTGTIETSVNAPGKFTAEFLIDNQSFRLALDEVIDLPKIDRWTGRSA